MNPRVLILLWYVLHDYALELNTDGEIVIVLLTALAMTLYMGFFGHRSPVHPFTVDTVEVSTVLNPRVFATIALLRHDYLCDFVMPFVITVALCTSWLVMKTEPLLRTRKISAKKTCPRF